MAALLATLVAAFATIAAASLTISLTKRKEREAEWRGKKLSYYEDFFIAASGIVGEGAIPLAKIRFATSVNQLHLIAAENVIVALHDFCDEIAESNLNRSRDRRDQLWSILVWRVREGLGSPPSRSADLFQARLWASGVGTNSLDSHPGNLGN